MDYNHQSIFNNGHHHQQQQPQQQQNGNPAASMYPLQPVHDSQADSQSDDDAGPSDGHGQDGGPSDSSPTGKKSQPKAQASFLTKLYDLLEAPEYQSMIRWDSTGEHIIVERPEMLALHVLPSIYRQSRFASFTRQLNIYGFFRKANLRNLNPGIEDPDASTWSHPTLRRSSRGTEAVTNFKRRVQDRKPKGRKKPSNGPGMGMGQSNFPPPHMQQYPTHSVGSRPGTGGIPGPPPPGLSPHHPQQQQQQQQQAQQQQQQQMQRQRALTQPSLHVNTRPMSSHGGPISAGPQTYAGQPSWGGAYSQQSQGIHGQYPSASSYSSSSHTTSPAEEANSHYQTYNPQSTSTFGLPTVYPGPASYPSAPEPQNNPAAWPSFNNAGPPSGPSPQQQQQQQPPPQNGPSSLSSLLNPAGYSRPNTAAGPGGAPQPPSISISTSSAPNSFASSSPYTASISHSPTASRPTTAYSAASSMPSVSYGPGEMDGQSGGGPQSAQGGPTQYDYRPRSSHSAQGPPHQQQQQQSQGPQSAHPLSQAHIPSRPSTGVAPSPTSRRPGQPQTPVQGGGQYGSAYPLRPMTAPDVNGKSAAAGLMGLGSLDGYGPSASPTSADFAHSVPPGPGDGQQGQVRPSTSHSSLSSASQRSVGGGVTPTPGQAMGMGMGQMVGVESHDYAGEHAS